jgi:hypothetical protein
MKAKAGFLMLLIGLICFTGFGLTTADPAENSTTELIQMDDSANVVSVSVMEISFDSFQMEAAFSLAENRAILPAMEFKNTISSELNLTINLTDDVGWLNSNYEKENPTHTLETKLHFPQRNASDGIMYGFLFSS